MRDGMAESGTCRRFSRLALMSAVSSGGSSVTCGTRASLAVEPADTDDLRRVAFLRRLLLIEDDANDGALVVAVARE